MQGLSLLGAALLGDDVLQDVQLPSALQPHLCASAGDMTVQSSANCSVCMQRHASTYTGKQLRMGEFGFYCTFSQMSP